MRKLGFDFDPGKKGLRRILGELESEIMERVWEEGEVTVSQLHRCLQERRPIAYTTVMTVMNRLCAKKLLARRKQGNAFRYRPTLSREGFTRSVVRRVMQALVTDFTEPAIHQFVDSLEDADPDRIDELSRLLEQARTRK